MVHQILETLTADHQVTLLAFCNEREEPHLNQADFERFARVKIFTIKKMARMYGGVRYPRLPLVAAARFWAAREWLVETLRDHSFDFVWFEFIQCASLMALVPPDISTRLVVHDLFFQAHERKATQAKGLTRFFWQWEAARTKRWEAEVISRAKEVFTLTEKDKAVAETITGRSDLTVRYPEVDKVYHDIAKVRGLDIRRGTILFWGQMSRRENEDGISWFVREIMPSIRQQRPHAKLIIAGANPTAAVLKLACDWVEITGFVADPHALFQTAEIAVAPLRLGAGIKIKVAEYMAAGIPTVATAIGAEGIRPSSLLHVSDRGDDFTHACVTLLAP